MTRIHGVTIRVNGRPSVFVPGVVSDLLRQLNIDPEGRGVAVAVNGEVVPRRTWRTHPLREGDEVEIVGAVQGG